MGPKYRDSTALHESAHAALFHLLGEAIEYLELDTDRSGIAMPFYSPCPLCGATVQEGRACAACLEYYEKNDPSNDPSARRIERGYRVEAAVAAAGEIAESIFGNGTLFASDEELAWDRDRVRTRASLRHLWGENACSGYCSAESDCEECINGANDLRTTIRSVLDRPDVWAAVNTLAGQLKIRGRIDGSDVRGILESAGILFGGEDIDALWSPLESPVA